MLDKEKLLSKFYLTDKFYSRKWKPFSKIMIRGDRAEWVLTSIANELKFTLDKINIDVINDHYYYNIKNQCVFYTSKYEVLLNWKKPNHRIAFPYFHGLPENSPTFKLMFKNINKHHDEINRIQVSHSIMEKRILETGIEKDKIHRIPISIDNSLFRSVTNDEKIKLRHNHKIPINAIVIGSFQKDGDGWGEGFKPKLIKGPDIFIDVLRKLKKHIPNIFVLLSGPSRGFMKANLKKNNIPYLHLNLENYKDIGSLYNCLDLYIVTSREEGGPRAILESMASGIPILSTKVGQSIDLIQHNYNGWLSEVSDVDTLVELSIHILDNDNSITSILSNAKETARINSYDSQLHLWKKFMGGFID